MKELNKLKNVALGNNAILVRQSKHIFLTNVALDDKITLF